jgi:hypothetical protein
MTATLGAGTTHEYSNAISCERLPRDCYRLVTGPSDRADDIIATSFRLLPGPLRSAGGLSRGHICTVDETMNVQHPVTHLTSG